jgi:hypothetical protein
MGAPRQRVVGGPDNPVLIETGDGGGPETPLTREGLQAAFQARYDMLLKRRERALSESGRASYDSRMAELLDFAVTLGIEM